jgi:hypothetical protein
MIGAQDAFPWVTTWPEAFVAIAVVIVLAWIAVTVIRKL